MATTGFGFSEAGEFIAELFGDMMESLGLDPENPKDVARTLSDSGFGAGAGKPLGIPGPAPMGDIGLSDSFGGRSPRGTVDPTQQNIAQEATDNADVAGLPIPRPPQQQARPKEETKEKQRQEVPGPAQTTGSGQTSGEDKKKPPKKDKKEEDSLAALAQLIIPEPRVNAPPAGRTAGNAPLIGLPLQQTPISPVNPFATLRNI